VRTVALVIMMAWLVSCGRGDDSSSIAVSAPPPPSLYADATDVTLAKMPIRIEATGQITALLQATLASRIQGSIQDIRVREGSVVSKDDVLIVLDGRDLRANLARAQADLDNRRAYLARIEDLAGRGSASRQDLDDARRAFKVAEAERQAAAAQLTYTSINQGAVRRHDYREGIRCRRHGGAGPSLIEDGRLGPTSAGSDGRGK
jgi:multidrug efflux pump subunit AcrA (membrane-fusion protein)